MMEQIVTRRLILRPFRESDYDDLYELLLQLKNDEFDGCPDITYENCKEHLAYRLGSEEYYAIERKDGGKMIGYIYLGERKYLTKEARCIIHEDFRKKGCGHEALDAVAENAFKNGTHRIYAECDLRNEAAWKLLEKAGFLREAHLRQNLFFRRDAEGRPVWKDTYVYAKLASDF